MSEIFSILNSNFVVVLLGSSLLMVTCSIIGTFNFLQKKSLLGDALSHSTLCGICFAFLITGNKDISTLMIGGAVAAFIWLYILKKIPEKSKIADDPATAIVLATSFALGIMALSSIQKTQNASQAGLNNFLLGKIASLLERDLYIIAALSVSIASLFFILLKEFTIVSFDAPYAKTIGLKVKFIDLIFTILTIFTIVVGVRIVGILLISAMLITPPAAARFWTNYLRKMLLISSLIGVSAGLCGVYFSYIFANMPTGPCIVIFATIFAYGSFLLAPKKGYLFRYLAQKKHKKKVFEENILKFLVEKNISSAIKQKGVLKKLALKFNTSISAIDKSIKSLIKKGYLSLTEEQVSLTRRGEEKGKKILRVHLLWETYLTQYLKLKPDHVHSDAEGVEHILTPAMVTELEKILQCSKGIQ